MLTKRPNEHWIDQHGVMHVKLTQGKEALIDAEDWPAVSQHRWRALHRSPEWYAIANTRRPGGGQTSLLLHQAVHGKAPKGFDTDHINGDGLDNRKANLRLLTHQQNTQHKNRAGHVDNTSGCRGVNHITTRHERNHYWAFECGWGRNIPGMPRRCCWKTFPYTVEGYEQAVAFAHNHWDTVHPDCAGFEETHEEYSLAS